MALPQLVLKKREDRRIRAGHLWVFSNEVARHPQAGAGALVEVLDSQGKSLGSGLYHPNSLISARLLGGVIEALDPDFFRERIGAAARLRENLFPGEECYRLIHGESDFLPGLLVDRFGDHLVLQTLTAGMEARLELICNALEELLGPAAILERNDNRLRAYEDLPFRNGVLRGTEAGPLLLRESGIFYRIDLLRGQKTGFFLDQKVNRQAVAAYCRGRSVLDCFCNVGGFALQAAKAGAVKVRAIDASQAAVTQARENAVLNGLEGVEFIQSDVFDFLDLERSARTHWDVVILDPPSFTRSKKNVASAKQGYQKLNEKAIQLIEPEGILATASCSFHIFEEVFEEIVQEAALRAGRTLQLLEWRRQSPDHPVLPVMPETKYLKLGIYRVL
jgi:23S rRNA (cytosine1962-C5)-methyltransferase